MRHDNININEYELSLNMSCVKGSWGKRSKEGLFGSRRKLRSTFGARKLG